MPKSESRGKGFLVLIIMLMLLVALCLLAGIAATIPARTQSYLVHLPRVFHQ
jgi:hypothetical protein